MNCQERHKRRRHNAATRPGQSLAIFLVLPGFARVVASGLWAIACGVLISSEGFPFGECTWSCTDRETKRVTDELESFTSVGSALKHSACRRRNRALLTTEVRRALPIEPMIDGRNDE